MHLPILVFMLCLFAFATPTLAHHDTPIVGGPCEGCQAALDGMPLQSPSVARLAPRDERGEPLRLTGVVMDLGQRPRAGVIVYAYQTDQAGHYPPNTATLSDDAQRHGRLRAWATTDAHGSYTFLTIRPGGYPGSDSPQHIHMHVIEPGCGTYYIDDVMFRDDPRLTAGFIAQLDAGRGGSGIVDPIRREGMWQVRRDIILGCGIPDYRDCTPPQRVDAL